MSHLGIRDDGLGHPPWCRGNATAVPATSKTAIAAGTVVLNRPPITRGTDSSNPSPSSEESRANLKTQSTFQCPWRFARFAGHRRGRRSRDLFTRENYVAHDGLPYDYETVERQKMLEILAAGGGGCWAGGEGEETSSPA